MKKLSLLTLNLINSIALSAILIFVFGFIFYQTHTNDLIRTFNQHKKEMLVSSKSTIKNMVNSTIQFIESRHEQAIKATNRQLKNIVIDLEKSGSNLANYLDIPTDSEKFKWLFWETMKPIGNEKNKFVLLIDTKTFEAITPEWINTNDKLNTPEMKLQYDEKIRNTVKFAMKNPEGGFITIKGEKIDENSSHTPSQLFVKYIPSFNLVIGCGSFLNMDLKDSEKEILSTVSDIRFGKDEYIYVINTEGITLSHIDPNEIGKSFSELKDISGVSFISRLLEEAAKPEGGYLTYFFVKPSNGKEVEKIAYAKEIKSLGWIVGSGVYLDNLEANFTKNYDKLQNSIRENLRIIALGGALMLIVIITISTLLSRKINSSISAYSSALERAIFTRSMIDTSSIMLPELEKMSVYTNNMLAELMSVERELKDLTRTQEATIAERTLELTIKSEELEHSTELARAANIAKSDFLANMSHEIRTPLNIILGMQELLLDSNLTDSQYNYLDKANTAATSLLGVISDILDFSKIEAGMLDIEHIEMNLEETLGNLLSFLNIEANKKELEIILDYDTDIPSTVYGDPLRLRQILSNICSNSIKFTDEGTIIIRAKIQSSYADGQIIMFTVEDTGIGIPLQKQRELFSPFKQADSSITRKFGGTGLGLIICKQLIELQGGSIELNSNIDKGTTISFTLSFETVDSRPALYSRSSLINDPKKKVLILDKNPQTLKILSRYFETAGIKVDIANSLAEGTSFLTNTVHPYHSILINSKLKDSFGITARSALVKNFDLSHTNTILMTMTATPESIKDSKKHGFDAILFKPLTPTTLINTVIDPNNEEFSDSQYYNENYLEHSKFKGISILIVEDNVVNQEIVEQLLVKMGCSVILAVNGMEAIELAKKVKFDLIFMDIQMPVLDGLSATIKIREFLPDIPIIAMTAHAMSEDYQKSIDAGMNDHLTKPLKREKLYEVISKYVLKTEYARTSSTNDEDQSASNNQPQAAQIEKDENLELLKTIPQINLDSGLDNIGGDTELYVRILTEYINLGEDALLHLMRSYSEGDLEAVKIKAHSIKGSCGTIGAIEVMNISQELENKLREDINANISNDVDILIQKMSDLLSSLKETFREQT